MMKNVSSDDNVKNLLGSNKFDKQKTTNSPSISPRILDVLHLTEELKERLIKGITDLYEMAKDNNPNIDFKDVLEYFIQSSTREKGIIAYDALFKAYKLAQLPKWELMDYQNIYDAVFGIDKAIDSSLMDDATFQSPKDIHIPHKQMINNDYENISKHHKTVSPNTQESVNSKNKTFTFIDSILYNGKGKIKKLWYFIVAIVLGYLFELYTHSTLTFNWAVFFLVSIPVLFDLFLLDEKFNKFWRGIHRDFKIVVTTIFLLLWFITILFCRKYIEEKYSLNSDDVIGLIHFYSYSMIFSLITLWQSNENS